VKNKPGAIDLFSRREFIDKLIKEIKEVGFIDIHVFGGGEPFFYKKNMMYFLENLKNVDVYLRVITNGMNLEEEDIKLIVKEGLVSQLNFTLNYASEDSSITAYGNKRRHEHTLYVLRNIKKYKEIYKVDYPNVDIMFVLMSNNYRELPDIIKLISNLNINFLFFQPLRVDCDYHKTLTLTEKDRENFIEDIPYLKQILSENNIRSNIDDFIVSRSFIDDSAAHRSVVSDTKINLFSTTLGCYFPLTTFAILNNGRIRKCFFLLDSYYRHNYLKKEFKLVDFLRSSEFRDTVGNFTGPHSISNCSRCTLCVLYEFEEIKRRVFYYASAKK
jgi:MoaA/NifB/PqqE/SkfB family radical SAM enzyme